ncbi:MAG: ABC transporter permease [Candidatus Acidiferrales bacterium]
MKQRRKLWVTVAFLAAFHLAVLFAGFFAPYNFATQNRDFPFAPPTRVHFVDGQGKFHVRPFVYGLQYDSSALSGFAADHSHVYPIQFFASGPRYTVAGLFSSSLHLFEIDSPGRIFLLGSDGYGRDQFSRFLYGGQLSLLAGLLAAALSVGIGITVGALAGFYGGWIDDVLMRSAELFLALPWLYLLLAVRSALPLHVSESQVFLLLICVIGLIGWSRPGRLIRGAVLSAKERNFVLAARGFGASDLFLLRQHVVPQTYGIILTQLALLIPQYILAEVTLTFLGLGVGEPMPSWGSLFAPLQRYAVLVSDWWMFIPALILVPVFLAYYFVADTMQERLKSVAL